MEQILKILQEIRQDSDFMSSTDFIEDYLLDSFDIMLLTSVLEEKYNIKIQNNDIIPENYRNLSAIYHFVESLGGRFSAFEK